MKQNYLISGNFIATQGQNFCSEVVNFVTSPRFAMFAFMFVVCTVAIFAQGAAGDFSAGTSALTTVTEEIAKYVPITQKLCYAIAGVVAIVGAISVYINITSQLTMPFR